MAVLADAVYGAAVGDALGVPFEFKRRGSFTCQDMVGHGSHLQAAGTWSDDTSLTLATCDSIRACNGRIDLADMRSRFRDWLDFGYYAIDNHVFDVGGTTSEAITNGEGRAGERDNGNGSLMRIAPLAFTAADDDTIRAVSALTHAHPISTEGCVAYVHICRDLMAGVDLASSIAVNKPGLPAYERLDRVTSLAADEIKSGGFVVSTLEASLWCLARTTSFKECVLAAVNLGGDTDTTACVAGALAGIVYGKAGIPAGWITNLRGKDIIESCLF